MNVQRDVYGKLRPAEFPDVLKAPPVSAKLRRVFDRIQRSVEFAVFYGCGSEPNCDFHGQRMTVVR